MIKKLIIGTVLSVNLLFASSVEINVNNDTLELHAEYSLNEIYNLNNDSKYDFTLSYLNSDESDENSKIVATGLKIMNPYINDFGISIGFGAKFVWVDNNTDSFMAIPLNLFAKYEYNEQVSVNANFSYSPSVLSFSNAKKYQEWQIKINYKVIDNGFIYIGKRDIRTVYSDNTKIEADDSFYFGFKALF